MQIQTLFLKSHVKCCPEELFLGDAEGSKSKGLAAGLWCGAAGGVAHVMADSAWISRRTHQLLADLELADPELLSAQREKPDLQPDYIFRLKKNRILSSD